MGDTANAPDLDPRIAHTRRVVPGAALAELGEVGYGNLTIESVAARAGVAKSTIYRHWDGKLALVADALRMLNQQPQPSPGDGTAREQVAVLLHHLVDAMADPTLSATVPALVAAAEHDPTIATFHHDNNARRRQTLVDVIATGVDTGQLDGDIDPDLAALALSGPIIHQRLMTDQLFPHDRVDDLVDLVLGPA